MAINPELIALIEQGNAMPRPSNPSDIRLTPPTEARILTPDEALEVRRAFLIRMEEVLSGYKLVHSSGHEVDVPALAEELHDTLFRREGA